MLLADILCNGRRCNWPSRIGLCPRALFLRDGLGDAIDEDVDDPSGDVEVHLPERRDEDPGPGSLKTLMTSLFQPRPAAYASAQSNTSSVMAVRHVAVSPLNFDVVSCS